MQDLEIINRQNARAEEEHAEGLVKSGKFVVTKYTGLNYYGFEAFDNEADRNQAALKWVNQSPGHRTRLLNPARQAVAA